MIDTESLDILDTRWIATSSGLSAPKLASMAGAHRDDVSAFLDPARGVSLTWAIRARLREQVAAQPVSGEIRGYPITLAIVEESRSVPVADVERRASTEPARVPRDGHGASGVPFTPQLDAPPCFECGDIMVRSASCYRCLSCGTSSGCS